MDCLSIASGLIAENPLIPMVCHKQVMVGVDCLKIISLLILVMMVARSPFYFIFLPSPPFSFPLEDD